MTTATFIRASLVRCATPLYPPDAPASIELRVVRGGSHVAGGLASGPLPFSFYDADATPYTADATPPHASVHGGSQVLAISPHISAHLPTSPHISPYLLRPAAAGSTG